MTKFKVGDKVRLLAEGEIFPVGEIGTVAEVFTDGAEPVYYVRFCPDEPDYYHNFGHHLDDELEPAGTDGSADEGTVSDPVEGN